MYVALRRGKVSLLFGINTILGQNLKSTTMLYGIMGIVIGGLAILFSKYVMPKLNEKMEQKAAEQKAIRDAKKAEKAQKAESELPVE